MKIRTAFEAAAAAFPGTGGRAAMARFMRRYGKRVPFTHYRCNSRESGVLKAFAEAAGFRNGQDFAVVESEFDADTRQIRWTGPGSRALEEFRDDLGSAMGTEPRDSFFDRLYVAACKGTAAAAEMLRDGRPREDGSGDGGAVAGFDVSGRTADILDAVLSAKFESDEASPRMSVAREGYVSSQAGVQKVNRKSPRLPVLAGPAVVEAYVRSSGTGLPEGVAVPDRALFATNAGTDDRWTMVRHLREDELVVPYPAVMWAPVEAQYLAEYGTNGVFCANNPLVGYLYRTVGESEPVLRGSSGLFAVGSEALRPLDAASLEFAADPVRLWTYVKALYEAAYGVTCLVLGQSRLAYGNFCGTDRLNPIDRWFSSFTRVCDGGTADVPESRSQDSAFAMFAMVLAPAERKERPSCERLLDAKSPITVTTDPDPGDGQSEEKYADGRLSRDDIPGEWFALTHFGGGTRPRPFPRPGSPAESADAVASLRDSVRRLEEDPASAANACDVPLSMSTTSSATDCVLSTLVDGVVTSLRKQWVDSEGNSASELPLKAWGGAQKRCHNGDYIVTGMYSGVWTSESPCLAEFAADPASKQFPSLKDVMSSRSTSLEGYFTDLVSALSSPAGAGAQLRMAPRESGKRRNHSVIVETNVSFDMFRGRNLSAMATLRSNLRNAFVQAAVYRNTDGSSAVDVSSRLSSFQSHHAMVCEVERKGIRWGTMFRKDGEYTCPSGNAGSSSFDSLEVALFPDSYGRTYVVYTAWDGLAYYAKCAYRYDSGLPVESAAAAAGASLPNGAVVVRVGDARAADDTDGGCHEYKLVLDGIARSPLSSDGARTIGTDAPFMPGPAVFPLYAREFSGNVYPLREWYADRTTDLSLATAFA